MQLSLLLCVWHRVRRAEQGDGARVDRVVHTGAGQYEAVEQRHAQADLRPAPGFERPAGGGAVPIDAIALAPLQRWRDIGRAVQHIADGAEGLGVENFVDGFAVEMPLLVRAAQAGAVGNGEGVLACHAFSWLVSRR